ncbi:peptidase domain-containing ABC transporter [Leuconostoc citreum]|uniref:peptidase domain-containing ABC transporter n=1 Tax=Leuconostoc citreum TaxID=33964 RepID=UPI000BFEBB3E|nr:peptidase domain-containing ABC transporter [Leuconostoc citreum]
MGKIKAVYQTEHSDCGLACVTMMLNYYGIPTNMIDLRDKFGVPKGGNNLFELKTVLNSYGIEVKAVKLDGNQVVSSLLPAIAFWNSNHFVVIEKINKNNVAIVDPEWGKQTITMSEFLKKFGSALLFGSPELHKNRKRLKKSVTSQVYIFLKNHLKQSIVSYTSVLLMTLLFECLTLYLSFQTKNIIDSEKVLSSVSSIIPVVFVLLAILVFQVTRNILIEKLKLNFNLDLTTKFVVKVTKLPFSYFINKKSSDVFYKYTLISYMQQILNSQLIKTIVNIVFSVIYIFIMFHLSWQLALLTLFIGTIIVLFSIINNKYILKVNPKLMKYQSESQGTFLEITNGIETIKSVNAENNFLSLWLNDYKKYQKSQYKVGILSSIFTSIVQSLQFSLPFIIIFSGSLLMSQGIGTWGTVVGFSTIAMGFIQPLSELTDLSGQLMLLINYAKKIDDVLMQKSIFDDGHLEHNMNPVREINIKEGEYGLSVFEQKLIDNINLDIHQGEKIAIVGPSGAGKSTLLRLISGLYNSNTSDIRVNGLNKAELSYDTYRSKLVYTPQFSDVFSMSVYDNIVMNKPNISNDYFKNILKTVTLDKFIELLPQHEHTILSENGMNISGGQKQKIAIARTLVQNPDVILLDESTSSLDYLSEKMIIDNLNKLNKTLLFATHRLNSISKFDRIVVMEDGEISGVGTHNELLKNNLLYRQMNENMK